ncbi:hypothetical protein BD324DRAFT_582139 [Kockovaella imperatae]|uniref:F-box domain-containing protein n=1 Tax=Kockovaella imperatae TaxID=4999 RepID=A0A1Y1UDV0_9TREE|nr:hypothetical protein BD324DRAFT_582139 [Kockovaella imperatae]ORX35255.1 hypothetical protein BD324DRAFT_582139 [Kockovaella imperatae]
MPEDAGSASKAVSASITKLPTELIDQLLNHIPPDQLQRTALSLIQVFPEYGLSTRHLWIHLVVHRGKQLIPLWRRLQRDRKVDDGRMSQMVRTFCMKSWAGDADILNNVMRCLPDVPTLLLNVGTNFAPEHLQEMFETFRPRLRRLEVRFRPYVEEASYYQFLKGSYFDSAVETMFRTWGESETFTHLSFIQDIPPRTHRRAQQSKDASNVAVAVDGITDDLAQAYIADRSDAEDDEPRPALPSRRGPFPYLGDSLADSRPKEFAQPMVFFDVKCIWRFGTSPVARHLTHLRLRVPSRNITSVLILHHLPGYSNTVFPALRYLDVSTTNVRLDTVLSTLLKSYTLLEHLVLDRTNLFAFGAGEKGSELCKDLGSLCVAAGLSRGKERERRIALWDATERARIAQAERIRPHEQPNGSTQQSSETPGSSQNAAASSTPGSALSQERLPEVSRPRRGNRSVAQPTFSIRDRPRRGAGSTAAATGLSAVDLPSTERAYFVLPPLPCLKTISIGGEAHAIGPSRVDEWERQFQAGWAQSLERLSDWAEYTAERYERAKRKAEDWKGKNDGTTSQPFTQKGKKPVTTVKPPLDVRLYRFPRPDEPECSLHNQDDPTMGLVEVQAVDRSYLDPYLDAMSASELHLGDPSRHPAPCIMCTVPDCKGPTRRGAGGERVDEVGGMNGKHREGCGHLLGRQIWGWQSD